MCVSYSWAYLLYTHHSPSPPPRTDRSGLRAISKAFTTYIYIYIAYLAGSKTRVTRALPPSSIQMPSSAAAATSIASVNPSPQHILRAMQSPSQNSKPDSSKICCRRCLEEGRRAATERRPPGVKKHLSAVGCSLLTVASFLHLLVSVSCRDLQFQFTNFDHKHFLKELKQKPFILNQKNGQKIAVCKPFEVCNKVDTYSSPWVERQCRCPNDQKCSTSLDISDGHTIADKSKQFKICESVSRIPICRYFHDRTWTLSSYGDNTTTRQIFCRCPKRSVAYIFKNEVFHAKSGTGYKYHFACSPESKLGCRRKEPCQLFTVKKRRGVEEVNTNSLCQCPRGYQCPGHHKEPSVIPGTAYPLDNLRTFSGYCSRSN